MKRTFIYSVVLILTSLNICKSQTIVSGGIFSNTVWTKSNSPYIVVGPVAVFPGNTLTIQAGVEVRFDSTTYLDIRDSASIIALGTKSDSIKFISNDSIIDRNDWDGIKISSKNDSALFEYALFKNSQSVFDLIQPISIKNCVFEDNIDGIIIAQNMLIDSCTFINHEHAIFAGPGVTINACTFIDNVWAVDKIGPQGTGVSNGFFCNNEHATFDVDTVSNSVFVKNKRAIRSSEYVINNTLFQNHSALELSHDGKSVYGNHIFQNDIGVSFIAWDSTQSFLDNNVCLNDINISINSTDNIHVPNICFCENDSSKISSTILDGRTDVTKGLFEFNPWKMCDTSILPTAPDTNCFNTSDSTINSLIWPESQGSLNIVVYPNPTSDQLFIEMDKLYDQILIAVRNINGELIFESNCSHRQRIAIDFTSQPGLYFVSILSKDEILKIEKVIKK